MQTFLPYPDIIKSVQCLDNKRLGKQRVEAMQILKALSGCYEKAWINHPTIKMWAGYEDCLECYMNNCIAEWIRRGFNNTMKFCITSVIKNYAKMDIYFSENFDYPEWWGNKIHSTHRAALLAKNYEYYKQFNWTEEPKIDYYWPVK